MIDTILVLNLADTPETIFQSTNFLNGQCVNFGEINNSMPSYYFTSEIGILNHVSIFQTVNQEASNEILLSSVANCESDFELLECFASIDPSFSKNLADLNKIIICSIIYFNLF